MTAKSGETGVAGVRVRQSQFRTSSNGSDTQFEFVEVHGADYEANRLTILTQSGPLAGAGPNLVVAISRLRAIGMCVRAHGQQRS
jgi:hypothetical protein